MGAVDETVAAVKTSDNQVVRLPVALSHVERVTLALEHDIHSVWDLVTGMWAFSRGVPEEVVFGYQAETDSPMTSDVAAHPIATEPYPGVENPPVKEGAAPVVAPPSPEHPVPVADAIAAAPHWEEKV